MKTSILVVRAARLFCSAILLCLASLCFAGLAGCASIQSTSISDMTRGSGHRISAEDTGHGFFMVSIPPLDAAVRLRAQCAGTITGVQTTTWMRNWLYLVQHYHQETIGWCQTN